MVWQLRVVVAITVDLVVALMAGLGVFTPSDRPRSREEAQDRLREARANPGYSGGDVIRATRTGSWILSGIYVTIAIGAGLYFTSIASR